MKYFLLVMLILSGCQPAVKDTESKKCKHYGFKVGSEEFRNCVDELEYTPTPPF